MGAQRMIAPLCVRFCGHERVLALALPAPARVCAREAVNVGCASPARTYMHLLGVRSGRENRLRSCCRFLGLECVRGLLSRGLLQLLRLLRRLRWPWRLQRQRRSLLLVRRRGSGIGGGSGSRIVMDMQKRQRRGQRQSQLQQRLVQLKMVLDLGLLQLRAVSGG